MTFHETLKSKIDDFVHLAYQATKQLPKEEIYGISSQLRRSALSVALNYIEGFARFKIKVQQNFLEISYGSLKEALYLVEFCYKEKLLSEKEFIKLKTFGDEIGAMLWPTIKNMK